MRTGVLRVEALRNADDRLAETPDDLEAHFARARLLAGMNRAEEARASYFEILRRVPGHFGALNNLGALLYATGFRTAARTAYTEAVTRHPGNPMGHVNLAHLLRDEGELERAREHYEIALRLAPDYAEAHRGLAILFLAIGDEETARQHLGAGIGGDAITTLTYQGRSTPIPVLLLVSAANGNAPFLRFLDNRVFLVTVMVTEFYDMSRPLPAHEIVVNAIGDSDLCGAALKAAQRIVDATKAPVINRPSEILLTSRMHNAKRLAAIPGVVAARTENFSKEVLRRTDASTALAACGFSFPFLLRSPGYHLGRNFLQISDDNGLAAAAASLPANNLTAIEFLDARGVDGKWRKYRVMTIGGRLYPAHLAVSSDWKVHYFSADMADHPEYRAEDRAFLENMSEVLGSRAMRAIEGISDALGLDYAGIDFGVDQAGNVLLFEANAAMTVSPPDPDTRWDYRRAPIARLLNAAPHMILQRMRTPA